MKYNFGFKVEHQLCKDNLTLILGREKEIQTYGQLNTTLAQMCPDLPTGPTDDMEQMTWLGMSEYLFRDLVDGVTAKRIISGNAQHLFYPLKLSSLFFLLARLFFIFLCIFCLYISLHMVLYIPVYNMFIALVWDTATGLAWTWKSESLCHCLHW